MAQTPTRTIVLTIDPASDPLEGTVQSPGQSAVRFVGYMQLVAHLERNRADGDRPGRANVATTKPR